MSSLGYRDLNEFISMVIGNYISCCESGAEFDVVVKSLTGSKLDLILTMFKCTL